MENHKTNGLDQRLGNLQPGIVSRRVFHSPIIKWVFPARIRNERKNDVVFIGENLVELKEWDAKSSVLREIATKADFGSKIRCGSVLGERKTSGEYNMDWIQDEHTTLPPQILVLVLDSCRLVLLTAVESENGQVTFRTHVQMIPSHKPLQKIGKLIATDSNSRAIAVSATEGNLILYALETGTRRDHYTLADLILSTLIVRVDLVVLKMDFLYPPKEDIDRVTLVVVGVQEGKLKALIYSWDATGPLRPADLQSNKQTLGREHGMPISLIPLKNAGYFMLVEEQKKFLYLVSPTGSVEQADSASLEGTRDESPPEHFDHGLSCRKPLWINWARPVRNHDWVHEVVYLGREDGAIQYIQVSLRPFANRLTFDIFGSGGHLDGNIDSAFAILDIHQARNDHLGQVQSDHDSLGHRDYKLGYPDALVAAGNLSDGGIYEIGFISKDGDSVSLSRAELHKPQKRVTLPNWAPFNDIAVIGGAGQFDSTSSSSYFNSLPSDRESLFVAAGKEPYGTITEIRFGFEVPCKIPRRLLPDVQRQDPAFDLRYCSGIWPVSVVDREVVLLFSFPWRTVFAKIDAETLTISLLECGDTSEEPTLSATSFMLEEDATTGEHMDSSPLSEAGFLQITPTQIRLFKLDTMLPENSNTTLSASLIKCWPIENTFVASIQQSSHHLLIATQVNQADSRPRVSLARVVFDCGAYHFIAIGPAVEFEEEISCVSFLEFSDQSIEHSTNEKISNATESLHYAAVGTASGVVHIFAVDSHHGLQRLIEYKTPGSISNVSGITALESIAALTLFDKPNRSFVLLCGSRGGVLHALYVELGDVTRIRDTRAITFGNGSLRLIPDSERPGCAFVCCGRDICHLDLTRGSLDEYHTRSVYFTDPLDDSFSHGSIGAMCDFPSSRFTGPLSGCLMGLTNSEIVAGNVKYHAKHLPLRCHIPGTPTRLLYSSHLKSLLIGSTMTQIYRGKRYAVPTIGVLDRIMSASEEASQREIDEYDFYQSSYRFAPGEQLCDMIEWFTEKDSQLYHHIVATTLIPIKDGNPAGRIVYLQPKPSRNGKTTLKFRSESRECDPVSAICQDDKGSLIYCSGKEVKMRMYEKETQRFGKRTLTAQLPSPGIQITARDSNIVVTTQLHSTLIFKLDAAGQITETQSDTRPRAGMSHLFTGDNNLNFSLMTSMVEGGSTVSTFWPGVPEPAAFEATLPCRITRLARVRLRPSWKQAMNPILADRDIVGTGTDGSLFTFSLVHHSARRLLYFIQTMCLRNSRLCPLPQEDLLAKVSLNLRVPEPNQLHIDGGILARLLEMKDPRAMLSEMLDKEPLEKGIHPKTGAVVDCSTADERRRVFQSLLAEVAVHMDDDSSDSNRQSSPADREATGLMRMAEDPVGTALKFMGTLLEVPF